MNLNSEFLVVKFGGSSLAEAHKISRAAKAVANEVLKGAKVAVVVSAVGKTTDTLMKTAKQACDNVIPDQELDSILSMGERTSARIFTTALKANNVICHYLDPANSDWPIITNSLFMNAEPILPLCEELIRKHTLPLLEKEGVVVIPGFVGKTEDGRITTMGRGGSDVTALILAKALDANQVILVTDVDGIMSADPKIIKDPARLREIHVDALLGLADTGVKFLHTKALKYKEPSIELKVINQDSGDLRAEGTRILGGLTNDVTVETAQNTPATAVTIVGRAVSKSPQILKEVFQQTKKANASIIVVSMDYNSLIIYLSEEEFGELLESLHSIVVDNEETLSLAVRKNLAFIKVKGIELEETPGIINKLSMALYSSGVNIFGMFTITSSVLLFVDMKEQEKAVKLIKKSIKRNRH
jgi:aspartate kinase